MDQNKEIVEAYKPYIVKRRGDNAMNDGKLPELWDDEDIEAFVKDIYSDCINKECNHCPHYEEIDNDTCMSDIIMELWKKWHNAMHSV